MVATNCSLRVTRALRAVADLFVSLGLMRSLVLAIVTTACAGLVVSGCVEARYRSNSQHVSVTPWTHLSASDREAVLQVLSRATRQPILAISARSPKRGLPQLYAVSGFEETSEVNPWREYFLEKRPDGWHIWASGPVGQVSAGMTLSLPPSPSPTPKRHLTRRCSEPLAAPRSSFR